MVCKLDLNLKIKKEERHNNFDPLPLTIRFTTLAHNMLTLHTGSEPFLRVHTSGYFSTPLDQFK